MRKFDTFDITSMLTASLYSHPLLNDTEHLVHQDLIGQQKADHVGCGCQRPTSCEKCRTEIEHRLFLDETVDYLIIEAEQEDTKDEN